MILYFPVREFFSTDELGKYSSYGISAVKFSRFRPTKIELVSDVSCNFLFVLSLSANFTARKLAPCHLKDAVIDAIS